MAGDDENGKTYDIEITGYRDDGGDNVSASFKLTMINGCFDKSATVFTALEIPASVERRVNQPPYLIEATQLVSVSSTYCPDGI